MTTAASIASPFSLDVHLTERQTALELRQEAVAGLTAHPKELAPKWFYDPRGSRLFEDITRLPEYYPTRREAEILAQRARLIADLTAADTLIELGSGSSEKTLLLLEAFNRTSQLKRFVPFDVCEDAIVSAAERISRAFPRLAIHGVVGDFDRHLGRLPTQGRRMFIFLGGTLGNFKPRARAEFLARVRGQLREGDSFLLGADLVKAPRRLNAAYNDRQGVTAAFNLNILTVLNRALRANFNISNFEHLARYVEANQWVEMLLRSKIRQSVYLADAGCTLQFEAGEEMRTEVSTKFLLDGLERELNEAGLSPAHSWTDPSGDFSVMLAFPN